MTITLQSVITFGAVITAICVIFSKYNRGYDFVKHQKEQDEDIKNTKKEIAEIKEEQALIVSGVLACLKGLQEQGCDGAVSDTIKNFEEYLNKKAHALNGVKE